ncbi:cytochrome ubiquinol oxidase subunit I [Alteromonas mediterranea]|uniref:Cytochrome ubiquinol oxidase subunit I n=1 Tax=Alteromonas mediterranea TaxID=314275 RepID=A0AAC9NQ71_9ALTE|nr:cytochrome ubiquinol oxidase subunit I [Alteromonas mediterranea]APD88411.1 cytochrome ubiquinol oxidase subunit I [Alteromonas mediterranea]APD92589.1 cytochrome ubiquinol oxidase subunit I [Alteromonas mediterranea]APD96204.1 cytochrome ubiquinol oxidase subunit I [Alteromonas mediterranea]APE00451.1 cytochrome ubiquinol oxidase subunit I [Alteromonas mediterranea]
MELDPLVLSRIQFAFVVCFHAIFPVFTIGLASTIAGFETLYFKTENPIWQRLSKFWIQVFAVVFGIGVVSGIVMSFQFGTNWSNFSYATANFLGPVLSYEVITAFFLEAAFLGVLLFGREKVPQGVHLFAAIMVATGTFISSFWILSANSLLQTPDGLELIDGIYHVKSWADALFTASFGYRFTHMALASFLTAALVVAGVSAWFILQKRELEANKKALSVALWFLLLLAPLQTVVGDFHGLNTMKHQPTKVAAMEGNWETSTGVPLLLFAIPDKEAQTNHFELKVPKLASFILTHDWDGEVPGLKAVPKEEQPPVFVVFWSFRVMVGLGLLMVLFGVWGLIYRKGGKIYTSPVFLQGLRLMSISPFFAVLAGWIVTEAGRAPWLIYGQMTHAEGLTPSLTGGMALFSLIGYVVVYALVFSAGIYYLLKVFKGGLEKANAPHEMDEVERPARPFSAGHVAIDGDL